MNFKQALADASRQGSAERLEVISLNDYIDLVAERPTIAATAHQRVHDMIRAQGVADGLHAGEVSYDFFASDLFGLDVPLDRVVRYFETAAQPSANWEPGVGHPRADRVDQLGDRAGR